MSFNSSRKKCLKAIRLGSQVWVLFFFRLIVFNFLRNIFTLVFIPLACSKSVFDTFLQTDCLLVLIFYQRSSFHESPVQYQVVLSS